MPLEVRGHYVRERMRNVAAFRRGSFKTQVVGKHRRIAGRLRATGRWATQSMLHPLAELHAGRCRRKMCSAVELKRAFAARRHV
jgi:hypothetical protein